MATEGQVLLLICPVYCLFLSNSAWEVDLIDDFVLQNADFFTAPHKIKTQLKCSR